MRRLKFCFITALIMAASAVQAETIPPMKLDAPLDSLMYSTTEWSEPVNGLQMRVTYPTEIYYGEPLEVKMELKCDLQFQMPIRYRRQIPSIPKQIRIALLRRGSADDDVILDEARPRTLSLLFNCSPTFKFCGSCTNAITWIFSGASGAGLHQPVELGYGNEFVQTGRTVARRHGLSPGMRSLRVRLERWDEDAGYTTLALSVPFPVFAHPYVPLMHRLVVVAPQSYKLVDSCRLILDRPETLTVAYDYHDYLYRTSRIDGAYGMSSLDGDTVSLMGWPGSYSVLRFDDSLASERARHLDSIVVCLYSATGPFGHLGMVSGRSTLLFKRTVFLNLTEEERLKIMQCGALRVCLP